ncbi:MAG: hypothetical protein KJ893_01015 [Candidatus Omnitrophica bacterium]|nr:hypothetical protein [Candidatus Omnitrophota bacterium]MBU4478783.1 hypothetical protein [Candidatus Omnitrophota bacterium]MCG2703672.1 hypothetical protein [Candidatus Omnitrophota bacterium]
MKKSKTILKLAAILLIQIFASNFSCGMAEEISCKQNKTNIGTLAPELVVPSENIRDVFINTPKITRDNNPALDAVVNVVQRHLHRILVYDEVKNIRLGDVPQEDKPFIENVLANPERLNEVFRKLFGEELEIEKLSRISVNYLGTGYYKNVFLVFMDITHDGKKKKIDFILKVTKPGALEEATGIEQEDVSEAQVKNFVEGIVDSAELLYVYGLHPAFGLFFIFKKSIGDIDTFRGVIIETTKKGRTPRQVEGILRSKITDARIDIEGFKKQRELLYRQCIATYVLAHKVLGGESIDDFFPNNIILEDVGRIRSRYEPQLVDLDTLRRKGNWEFVGQLIVSAVDEKNGYFVHVIFDAILDVYGKEEGRDLLKGVLDFLEKRIQYDPFARFYKEEVIEEWKSYVMAYLQEEIASYERIEWFNVERVRDIAFLPDEVKKIILKVFKGYSLKDAASLQTKMLSIVDERRAFLENLDLRSPDITIRNKAGKERLRAIEEIEFEFRKLVKRGIMDRILGGVSRRLSLLRSVMNIRSEGKDILNPFPEILEIVEQAI